MSFVNYSPNGTYPTYPLVLPQDGETINFAILMDGIIKPLIDAVGENCERTFSATQTQTKAPGYGLGALTDTATFTVDVSKAVWLAPVLSQDCTVTMQSTTAPIPSTGQIVTITADLSASGFNYIVKREGGAVTVVTLITSAADKPWADLVWTGTVWRLARYGGGAAPGIGA